MKIALASPPFPTSLNDGLSWLEKLVKEAADLQAEIVCFPESYLPGYPGMGYDAEDRSAERLRAVGVIVADIDPSQATGLLAKRFKNALYY